MKVKSIFKGLAATVAVLAIASCSSDKDVEPVKDSTTSKVPLSVTAAGIRSTTREIIEDSYLPSGSEFSLRAYTPTGNIIEDAADVKVNVGYGSYSLEKPVYIPADGLQVTAVYPYQPNMSNDDYVKIEAYKGGTDYLWGFNSGYATINSPEVTIYFGHVLARITLRITTTEDNEMTYEFNSARLDRGNDEYNQCYDFALLDVASGKLVEKEWYGKGLPGELNSYYINRYSDPLYIDFLVIPGSTDYYVNLDSSVFVDGFNLPFGEYTPGAQYIYNVQISDGNKLVISDCQIVPWENTEMPDINIVE